MRPFFYGFFGTMVFIGYVFICIIYSDVKSNHSDIKKIITKNHKVVLSQIEKQINTNTEFIRALRDCLEDE